MPGVLIKLQCNNHIGKCMTHLIMSIMSKGDGGSNPIRRYYCSDVSLCSSTAATAAAALLACPAAEVDTQTSRS